MNLFIVLLKSITFSFVCPCQPKNVEHCAYYVMKYMWDIMANTNVSILEKVLAICYQIFIYFPTK